MTRSSTEAGVADEQDATKEQVDIIADNDPEDEMEEELEYEYEEIEVEEEVEESEEEVEEGLEKEEENEKDTHEADAQKYLHAELLALPPHGSEVYLRGIPQNASEEDMKSFCESIGEVREVRIMKDNNSSEFKGNAFVTYRDKDLASKAIEELNNTEFEGKKIKFSTSQANNQLFLGNVPKDWKEEDMKKVVMKVGPGVVSVKLFKDPLNCNKNRGFSFVEYYNHACAEYSRKKMSDPNFRLDDNAPTVSWADPKNEGSFATSQVKVICIKNLPKDITQDRVRRLFEHHGKVTKVVLPPAKVGHEASRIAFLHFAERSSAVKALKNSEKYELDGQVLDCSLAKPQNDQIQRVPGVSKSAWHPIASFQPQLGYGLVGGPLGATGFAQPMIYGIPTPTPGIAMTPFRQPMIYGGPVGPTPTGMAMMPMLLPDGRIGYILQQPGVQAQMPTPQPPGSRGIGASAGGEKSISGKHRNDKSHGCGRYNPY